MRVGYALIEVQIIPQNLLAEVQADWIRQEDGVGLLRRHAVCKLGESLVLWVVATNQVRPAWHLTGGEHRDALRLPLEVLVGGPRLPQLLRCLAGKLECHARYCVGVRGVTHGPLVLVRPHNLVEIVGGPRGAVRPRLEPCRIEVRDARCEREAHVPEPSTIVRGVPVLPHRQRYVATYVLLVLAPRAYLATVILDLDAGVRGLPREHCGGCRDPLGVARRAPRLLGVGAAGLGFLPCLVDSVEAVPQQ
mmetsp:Transcript_52257/g.144713  ORF Transcript_52257/g.144713 Transcript_52257/m.144713 type:complete len:249 (+) Transcript_52257:1788-2534(+)